MVEETTHLPLPSRGEAGVRDDQQPSTYAAQPSQLKSCQYFLGVLGRFYLRPDLFDRAIGTDEKGNAVRAKIFLSEKRFLPPDAVSLDDFFVFIRQKCEGEFELFDKFLMRLDRVRADAENKRALFGKICEAVPKRAGFLRATGGIVFGVEVEDDVPAFAVGKRDLTPIVGKGGKIWSKIALF